MLVLVFAICAFIVTSNSSTVSIPSVFVSKPSTANFVEVGNRLNHQFVGLGFRPTSRPSWANTAVTDADRWFVGVTNGERIHLLVQATESEYSVTVVDHEERFWIWQFEDRHADAHEFARKLKKLTSSVNQKGM